MKKAIALLVALTAALTVNIGVFAALDINARGLEWANNTSDQNPLIIVEENQLVLGYSANGGDNIVLPETFLKPGNEYSYVIYKVNQTYTTGVAPNAVDMTPVNDVMLGNAKLRIRSVKGSSNVVNAKIEKKGTGAAAVYTVKIETKETYGTKVNDLEYNIVVSGQPANAAGRMLDANVLFTTGYRAMLDSDIESYGEGDTITIPDDRPVITKKQFETLAKNYNYKAIEFSGEEGDWIFTGRVSGMNDANFTTTYDVAPEIIIAFPDQDYKFITFNAGVNFPTNGEMRVDVSDIREDINNPSLYAYLYRNGALTPISSTYDNTSDELVFRTNYLGSFVITNAEITDLITEPEPEEPNNNNTNNENPPTGAGTMGAVIALGIASLASAGAIKRSRKSK